MDWRRSCFGVILVLLTLVGCFVSFSKPSLAAQRVVEFMVYAANDKMAQYQAFFDAFEAKTGIKVVLQQAPQSQTDKWEQVITRTAGGLSPDIVGGVSLEFLSYAAKGLIQPVDDLVKRDNVPLKNIVPTLVQALQWHQNQYMVPYGASGMTLMYNSQLFEESGVPEPRQQWNSGNWTWESFVGALRKLTKRDGAGKPVQWGLEGPYWDSWITIPYNWGGNWIDATLTTFTGTQPGALASLQALQDLRWDYGVMPKPGEPLGARKGFLNGTAAVSGWGTWSLQQVIDSDKPFHICPWFKVGKNSPVGTINPAGLAMLNASIRKDEAWEFIKFATLDPQGNYLYSLAVNALPGTAQAYRKWQEAMQTQAPKLRAGLFVDQVAAYGAVINIRKVTTFADIDAVMRKVVDTVLTNSKSPAQAMQEAAPVVQAFIDQSQH